MLRLMVPALCWLASAFGLAQSATTSAQPGTTTAVVKAAPAKAAVPPAEADDASGDEETKKQQVENKARVLSLLQRSYGLNDQLSPREKLSALSRQAEVAARAKPELGRAWSDELFEAANDAEKPFERVTAQMGAIRALTQSDPEHGLELLGRLEPADLSSSPFTVDPVDVQSRELFGALFRNQGIQIIPKILAQARNLGERGAYPYAGMAMLVGELARSGKNSELGQSLFAEMTTFYEQNASSAAVDTRFANTLLATAALLPRTSVQEALELLVKNVLSRQYDSQQHLTATYTTAGGSTQLTDPADIVLSRLAGLLRQYNPDLAAKLAEDRPQLGPLLAAQRGATSISISSSSSSGGGSAAALQAQAARQAQFRAMRQIRSAAATDPRKAAALAQSLPDEAQVTTLTSIAASSDDPKESASLLEEADRVAQRSKNLRVELQATIAHAEAAQRSDDSAQLTLALQRGFAVANQLLRKEQEEHPGVTSANASFFTRLVRAGIGSNYDLVMGYIETIPWPYLKATLLVDAAEALLPEANRGRYRAFSR